MLDFAQNRTPRGIRIQDVCKHMFICGVPGSGKTTGVFSILLQLYERGIPFLVIETVKKEYRGLKTPRMSKEPAVRGLAETLEVYTAGVERISPLRFNPLWRPTEVDPDGHIDAVLRCFKGAMPMFEPLPALLGEALEMVCGKPAGSNVAPTMDGLYAASRRVLDSKGYSGQIRSDLSGALDVRLGMLTRRTLGAMLRATTCIPGIAHLATSHSIVEMDALEVEAKCLLTLFLLSSIHRHVHLPAWQAGAASAKPRLVIVIEEAHNIVGRSADAAAGANAVDTKAYATELICRMLAEFRALGVGLILIDQLPSQMAPQVVKNTGTKLAFHQVARDDRETLADTMLFTDLEYEEIARLLPGEAYLFAEGYHRAHRLRTPNLVEILHLSDPPGDEELVSLIRDEGWYQQASARQAVDVLLRFQSDMDRYGRQKEEADHQLEALLQQRSSIVAIGDAGLRRETGQQLAAAIERLGARVAAAFAALERGPYQEARQTSPSNGPQAARLASLQQGLLQRFEQVIRPQVANLRAFVERTVAGLKSSVSHTED